MQVRQQLAGLTASAASQSVNGQGLRRCSTGVDEGFEELVRVDEWLEWLVEAYLESKRNASSLFEELYGRY